MATIKELAAARGIRIGVGPVDPTGPDGSDPTVPWGSSLLRFPNVLDETVDPGAAAILEYGGYADLCLWTKENTDWSHYGRAVWPGPGQYNLVGPDAVYAWGVTRGLRFSIPDPLYTGAPDWLGYFEEDPPSIVSPYSASAVLQFQKDFYTALYTRYPEAFTTSLPNEGGTGHELFKACFEEVFPNLKTQTESAYLAYLCNLIKSIRPDIKVIPNWWTPSWLVYMQRIIAYGGMVDGSGLQGHWGVPYLDSGGMILNEPAPEVLITEWDSPADTRSAGYYADAKGTLKSLFATKKLRYFSLWALRDPKYEGYLNTQSYTTDMQPTPLHDALRDALAETPIFLTVDQGPLTGGTITLSGTRPVGTTVTVTFGGQGWTVSYPDDPSTGSRWSCVVTVSPGASPALITTSNGESVTSLLVRAPAVLIHIEGVKRTGCAVNADGSWDASAAVRALNLPAGTYRMSASFIDAGKTEGPPARWASFGVSPPGGQTIVIT